MTKWRSEKIMMTTNQSQQVPIISNAMIAAQPIGDGRSIPLIIIDCTNRKDISNLFENHKITGNGEINTRWIKTDRDKNKIGLFFEFKEPTNCIFYVEFNIPTSGALVDMIVKSQSLYIQPGQIGDTIGTTLDNDRIVVEIPSEDFEVEWNKIYRSQITKHFKKKYGVSQRKATAIADDFINEMKLIGNFKIK